MKEPEKRPGEPKSRPGRPRKPGGRRLRKPGRPRKPGGRPRKPGGRRLRKPGERKLLQSNCGRWASILMRWHRCCFKCSIAGVANSGDKKIVSIPCPIFPTICYPSVKV